VKADPEAQRRLLDLQAIDTALAQLDHRRRTLPEIAELDALARELSSLEDERLRAQVAVDDIARDVSRMEKDVEQVRVRADRDRARLDAGTGPAKELEALQHELTTLSRRQSELEDAELELMEQQERSQSVLDGIDTRLTTTRQTRAEAETRRDESLSQIDGDRRFRQDGRTKVAADLPADLLALYERIRESTGIGAALLRAGRCEGCRLELAGSERSKVKATAPDEVVRHEECGRILVRTNESGL
jgi:predicted  nucleic acid-binding Zn-ribbon protein